MRKQEQTGKITALYERLSHDDGRSDESVSVENQKRILEDYARKNGFTNVRHFTDDGVRGTTFKRPGLDAMVDEIRAGNVAKRNAPRHLPRPGMKGTNRSAGSLPPGSGRAC